MRLLFDLTKTQPIGGAKYHGGGKYGLAVLKKLLELKPSKVAAYYDDNLFIEPDIMGLLESKKVVLYKKSHISILDAAQKEGGVVYSSLIDRVYLNDSLKKVIVTIHGLRNLEMVDDSFRLRYKTKFKSLIDLKSLLFSLVQSIFPKKIFNREIDCLRDYFLSKNIDIITVSEHSKYSIKTFFPFIRDDQLKMFYSPSAIQKGIEPLQIDDGKYYLIVSGNRWVKNSIRGVLAFDELFSERPNFKGNVIVTGITNISDFFIKIKNPNRFKCVGYVDENQLKSLYHSAYALLYPSLNEGFGYPPLEAMYEGTPVAASAIASIPEICADAVLYFNPYSIKEMKMRILQLEDECVYRELIERGRKRQREIEKKQDEDLLKLTEYLLSCVKD